MKIKASPSRSSRRWGPRPAKAPTLSRDLRRSPVFGARVLMMGCGSVGELHLNPHVQHIGSHPHSPGRCDRRLFIFTALRICRMSMLGSARTVVLMMQFFTYFRCFNQCQLSFMAFPSSLHAAVAFSIATLFALGGVAASAGIDMAMPPTNTVAIMPAIKVVVQRYMIRSFEPIRSLESLWHFQPGQNWGRDA